jgi:uncharacterized protein (TIGR02231 family)
MSALLAFALAWSWAPAASAIEAVSEAKPSAVTVYAQRARVTRSATVELPAGRHDVRFTGLPNTLDPASFTADATGGAELTGIDSKRITARDVADVRVKEIEAKLLSLRDQRQVHADDLASRDAELAAIAHARTEAGKALSAQLLVGDKAPERARALRVSLATEETKTREARRAAAAKVRELDLEIAALDRERQGLGSGTPDTYDAVVHLELSRPARLTVSLSYLVGGAGWTPQYDLRGDGSGKVAMSLSALVTQSTGEDWSQVRLAVSSARPDRGTTVPVLDPFWLQAWRPPPRPASAPPSAGPSRKSAEMAVMEDAAPAPPPPAPMEVAKAQVEVGLSATTFEVKRPEDIPADGSRRKVLLTTEALDAELRHVVLPRVDTRAWLVGEVTNSAPFPLLAGEAGVFLDGAYIGDTFLDTVAPGATFDLAFGSDDRVAVKRRPAQIELGASAGAKREKSRWEWEVVVRNGRKTPIRVELKEQIPVSNRAEISVALNPPAKGAPAPKEEPGGMLSWRYEVPAGAEHKLAWGYAVEYPAGLGLGWME